MEIGILGSGNIGGNLGRRLTELGHRVRFGVRDPAKVADLVQQCGGRASAGDVASAARFGEIVVLAVPWQAVDEVLEQAAGCTGRILVDATNAVRWDHGPVPAAEPSGAELIAAHCPGARVVKAFNTIGAEHLMNPVIGGIRADTFVCGDDPASVGVVSDLARAIGFDVVDMGPLRNARLVEHLAVAWIHLATVGGLGRDIAFKVLRPS